MAGIYIHIPFCKQKCSYCDFHFSTTFENYRSDMIEAIINEIEVRKDYLVDQNIETLYFGGGTPSLLTFNELSRIIKKVKTSFPDIQLKEITLEANPDDINKTSLIEWKKGGVNRLSIGLQSLKSDDLKWMNRAHTVEEALKCIPLARRNGFDNLTIDLIYGLPNLTLEDWENAVQWVINQKVPHISAYCLTVEEKTSLHKLVKTNKIKPASEDQQSEQFTLLVNLLQKQGYEQYEVSNFALKGFRSVHNGNYWKGEYYLGIGPSAHSFNGKSRSWNIANNSKYIQLVKEQKQDWIETEVLSHKDRFNELLLTGLRTTDGLKISQLAETLPFTKEFDQTKSEFIKSGWMIEENGQLKLTKEGLLKADYIASELFII
ncbi:MAG: radical SAM family heme chaperone HemW [Crocinitomicaceae bacterium]